MEINIQSLKFDADVKLLDFIKKKLSKLPRFNEEIVTTEVTLSLLPDVDNKNVQVRVSLPGDEIVVEKQARRFEDAVVECVSILKDSLVKAKEKRRDL